MVRISSVIINLSILLWACSVFAFGPGVMQMGGPAAESGSSCSGDYGWTGTTGTETNSGTKQAHLLKITLDCAGTISSISAYLKDASSGTQEIKFAVYSDSTAEPSTRLYESAAIYDAATSGSFGWVTDTAIDLDVSAGDYWIGFTTEGALTDFLYNTGTSTVRFDTLATFAFPSSWDTSGDTDSTSSRPIKITF